MELSWYEVLHGLSEQKGLEAEADFQTYFGSIATMTQASEFFQKQLTKLIILMRLKLLKIN